MLSPPRRRAQYPLILWAWLQQRPHPRHHLRSSLRPWTKIKPSPLSRPLARLKTGNLLRSFGGPVLPPLEPEMIRLGLRWEGSKRQ